MQTLVLHRVQTRQLVEQGRLQIWGFHSSSSCPVSSPARNIELCGSTGSVLFISRDKPAPIQKTRTRHRLSWTSAPGSSRYLLRLFVATKNAPLCRGDIASNSYNTLPVVEFVPIRLAWSFPYTHRAIWYSSVYNEMLVHLPFSDS